MSEIFGVGFQLRTRVGKRFDTTRFCCSWVRRLSQGACIGNRQEFWAFEPWPPTLSGLVRPGFSPWDFMGFLLPFLLVPTDSTATMNVPHQLWWGMGWAMHAGVWLAASSRAEWLVWSLWRQARFCLSSRIWRWQEPTNWHNGICWKSKPLNWVTLHFWK